MHVLLVTVGSAGDVHPFVGMGLALRARGHRVTLITSGYFQGLAEKAGLDFVAVGTREEFQTIADNPDLWHPSKGIHAIIDTILSNLEKLYSTIEERYVPGETVMAASSLALGARIAQDKLGIPTASVHLSPSVLRSMYETPKLPQIPFTSTWPRWTKRLILGIADTFVIDPACAPKINELRRRLGLGPARGIFKDWWHSRDRIIGMWPEWFGATQPDWPEQVRLTGFPLWDERGVSGMSDELVKFLAEGDAPVLFTPGSAMFHGEEFFEESAKACALGGKRGILLSRHSAHIPKSLPKGVRHFDYAPFSELLPRACALVHHGGIGTTSQALAAGVVQVPMPMSHDQFDNAWRVERLGVGVTAKRKEYRAAKVAEILGRVTGNEGMKRQAREVAKRFEEVDGIAAACELIEGLGVRSNSGSPLTGASK
jgi:rhamnosyltransferase subunit B